MIKAMIPIAPISVKGPLGLAHLPRMWAKALLYAKGALVEGYRPGCLFDRTVMERLGIDVERALDYLCRIMPTYAEFEAWVVDQAGGAVDPAVIEEINDFLLHHEFSGERLAEFQEALGLSPGSPIRTAAELDTLDDWAEFHKLLTQKG